MRRSALKNFSDMDFIQRIDKPRFMSKLLFPYTAYFAALGLDVGHLGNDNAFDKMLLDAFTTSDGDFPPKLLNDLYVLDDLAEDDGRDLILEEAEKQSLSLDGIVGQDLTAGEFAIAVHLAHPRILTICHDKMQCRKVRNYEEYQARQRENLTLELAKEKTTVMESEMAPWFEAKDRSRACEIYVYQKGQEVMFQITHGRPFRVEPCLNRMLERGRTGLRPQKHDSVIYDTGSGVLKVNAQSVGERDLYRRTFGKVLFGDPEYFPGGEIYTLDPLRNGKAALAVVPGIESVRLTEISIAVDNDEGFAQVSKAHDLIEAAARYGQPNFQQGTIVRAGMVVKYKAGGRGRKLELRPPRVAVYDRDRDGVVTEAFMRTNGFLKVG